MNLIPQIVLFKEEEKQVGVTLVMIEDLEVVRKLEQMMYVCQEIFFQVKKYA